MTNELKQRGVLLSVSPTQWNTRLTIEIPGPEGSRKWFGEFEWDIPDNVMDINDACEIPIGTELLLEGYVKLSQGKDKGDGRPPFVFKNLVASSVVRVGSEDLPENGWDQVPNEQEFLVKPTSSNNSDDVPF